MEAYAFVSKLLKGANVKTTAITIEITVSIKGDTKVETIRISSNDYQVATHKIEIALGARDTESLTKELNQQSQSELTLHKAPLVGFEPSTP